MDVVLLTVPSGIRQSWDNAPALTARALAAAMAWNVHGVSRWPVTGDQWERWELTDWLYRQFVQKVDTKESYLRTYILAVVVFNLLYSRNLQFFYYKVSVFILR